MNATNDAFLANLLETAPGTYARDAAGRMAPSGGQDQNTWRESFTGWIEVLSAAVRSGRPALFASHIAWLHSASTGRAQPAGFLQRGLDALHKALGSSLPEGSTEQLRPYFSVAAAALQADAFLPPSALQETPFADEAVGLLQELVQGNARQASSRVRGLVAAGHAPADVILELLVPAERELGRLWHMGELTIAEEHFGTRVIRRILGDVLTAAELDLPSRGCVVLAGAVGDEHDLGLAMLSALFELEGWRSIDLGANVPIEELVTTCAQMGASVIVLSASLTTQLQAVTQAIQILRERANGIRILVGGYAFAGSGDLWKQIGADGYGATMLGAIELAAGH